MKDFWAGRRVLVTGHPVSIYGHCKLALWHAIEGLARYYKMQAAWGRVFLPYGPGDSPARLVPPPLPRCVPASRCPCRKVNNCAISSMPQTRQNYWLDFSFPPQQGLSTSAPARRDRCVR